MLPLVLALLSAQPAPSAPAAPGAGAVVLVVRHEGLSTIESSALADRLGRALADAKVPLAMSSDDALAKLGKRGAKACRNKPACVAQLGRGLGVAAVFVIDAGRIFEDLPVRIQLVDVRDGTVLLDRTGTVAADRMAELDTFFRKVAQEAPKVLAPLPSFTPPPVADVTPEKTPEKTPDKTPDKTPENKEPPRVVLVPPPDAPTVTPTPDLTPRPREPEVIATAQPSPLPRYLTGGGAVLAGAAAVAFAVLGTVQYSRLQQTGPNGGSPLTFTQANGAKNAANNDFKVAGVLGGVAAALGVVTFVLPGPQPAK